ncbi:MAG: diacylglycerol/lipid kinase family protein [Myxococcaceae bacterium]
MYVQPLRNAKYRSFPSRNEVVEPKVAVLLNANARKVGEKVVRSLSHVVPEKDLFLSRSQLDARRIAETVLERRYDTVFCGGGDGTFIGFVNEIYRALDQRRQYFHQRAPRFGILKLGTGNGLASLVSASSTRGDGVVDDVLRARSGEVPGSRRLDMLMIEGKRAHFAGLGVDGKLLNDYLWVKNHLGAGPLKSIFTGGGGYFSSVAFKTLPHFLTQPTWVECEVKNGKSYPAYRLSPEGLPVGSPIAPGETLFRGRLMMASAATMPFYGYGLKMFPFAGMRRGMMHLRLGAVATPYGVMNLRKLWKGKWFPRGIQDFHAQEVNIRFARPMALQVAGDAEGYREQLTIGMAPETVELADFSGTVN